MPIVFPPTLKLIQSHFKVTSTSKTLYTEYFIADSAKYSVHLVFIAIWKYNSSEYFPNIAAKYSPGGQNGKTYISE